MLDLTSRLGSPGDTATVSTMAGRLVGSEILRIAADIRAMQARGDRVCNLTVGDFNPKEFPIPAALGEGVAEALRKGETNYPPSDGVLELRHAVRRYYERTLGLKYPVEGIVIAGGARPIIYGTARAVLDKGDTMLFPVPSWNNNHYAHLMEARGVAVATLPENGFMPTAASLERHLTGARLLVLCSPSNPTGTMIPAERLKEIAQLIVEENRGRAARGEKPLILIYDQIYWRLTLGDEKHVTPIELVPEIAPYTVFVDGISKAFAATGLRVGWGVGPPSIVARMRDVLGHVGAWAPKAEQIATIRWLDDVTANEAFLVEFRARIGERLKALYEGLNAMRARGLPVRAIAPQGAIYLTVQFDLINRPGIGGMEGIRKLLLEKAGFALVPFRAFDLPDETGWFRISVGAVSMAEIAEALPRVEAVVRAAMG